jgi:hypothetical protein
VIAGKKGSLIGIRASRTHRLLSLGVVRPVVRQEDSKLARGDNKDVLVCWISQTASIYAIYLRVVLNEVGGSGH